MVRFKYISFFILFFFLLSIGTFGQKTKVFGKITDAKTGEPVPFVNISFKDSKIGTSSGFDGNYIIETYYATDSLIISGVGYKRCNTRVKKDIQQELNIKLQPSDVELKEIVIKFEKKQEDPAYAILRNIIKNKDANNREKLEAYEYEAYNKVQFDLNNLTKRFTDRKIMKPFEFIFDNIDSLDGKVFLPIFITESLSDYYYVKKPKSEKEVIKATKISGIKNESVSQFLGDMYQNVNVYKNYINVFGKNFISPVADFGKTFYRYYLIDSAYIGNNWCYKIKFERKRKQELAFSGHMWVNDTTYAIKEADVEIAYDANINFINSFKVHQEYNQVEKEVWMITKDQLIVDFNITDKALGFFGRKTTSYKDFKINKPRNEEFYNRSNNIVLDDQVNQKSDKFWSTARHDSLSATESQIYYMVDTMQNIPQFKTYIDIIALFATSYWKFDKFEFGPYFNTLSFNSVEGTRIKIGGRTTPNLFEQIRFDGFLAYGLKDEKFKYHVGVEAIVGKKPRQRAGASYTDDVEQLGLTVNSFQQDNILSAALMRNSNLRLTQIKESKAFYEFEWFYGLSNTIQIRNREMFPLGSLAYQEEKSGQLNTLNSITTTDISINTRFAYREKFLYGRFDRVSLGTKYPTIELTYTMGLKGVLGNDYDYQQVYASLNDRVPLGIFGYSNVYVEASKYYGELPYPLLELHKGNQTYALDDLAFNTMNFFEFVSDQYVSGSIIHHWDGFFLNRLPLFRKLKWREVTTAKAVYGSLSNENKKALILPSNMYTLSEKPYIELGMGVENIFKVLRFDMVYRISYLNNPNISRIGFRGGLQVNF